MSHLRLKKVNAISFFDIFNVGFMIFLCAIAVYPFLYILARSVMPEAERALNPYSIIPRSLDFSAYTYMFSEKSLILSGYQITIFRAVVGTLMSLVVESMFAYAISKKDYPPKLFLTGMIALTMWFSGGLIPSFLINNSLGFVDSVWVYIIPRLMSAWNILIMRNFFAQIPGELEESARIDGANEATILIRIILPLSMAVIATIGLFHLVAHWNEWFTGIIYMRNRRKLPIQLILRNIIQQASQQRVFEEGAGPGYTPPSVQIRMALTVVVAFPIIMVYPFFQKYFTKGVMLGAIKG